MKIPRSAQSAGNLHKGSSETIRVDSFNFNQWLGGLIDGDGYFGISRTHYVSCEITVHLTEIQVLYKIKDLFGGSVTLRNSTNTCRWRLHSARGMKFLIEKINGFILSEKRYRQFEAICKILKIEGHRSALEKDSSWLVGFFDAEGHIRINPLTSQPSVTIAQKDYLILYNIAKVWKGYVVYDRSLEAWVWIVTDISALSEFSDYLFYHKLQMPLKQARLHTFRRYLLYLSRRDPSDLPKITKLIKRFNHKE